MSAIYPLRMNFSRNSQKRFRMSAKLSHLRWFPEIMIASDPLVRIVRMKAGDNGMTLLIFELVKGNKEFDTIEVEDACFILR